MQAAREYFRASQPQLDGDNNGWLCMDMKNNMKVTGYIPICGHSPCVGVLSASHSSTRCACMLKSGQALCRCGLISLCKGQMHSFDFVSPNAV